MAYEDMVIKTLLRALEAHTAQRRLEADGGDSRFLAEDPSGLGEDARHLHPPENRPTARLVRSKRTLSRLLGVRA